MARANRDAYRKKLESDMRKFGSEVTNWADTHSQITDEAEPLLRRWKSLNQRFEEMEKVPEGEWGAYASGLDRDYSELKGDYQRARSKYDVRH